MCCLAGVLFVFGEPLGEISMRSLTRREWLGEVGNDRKGEGESEEEEELSPRTLVSGENQHEADDPCDARSSSGQTKEL